MQKPRFFISSTIYDFKDLRSALKYYLEQQGCSVAASEYPDFKISTDKHSYDACLESIEHSDYFVLLIGARIGGWYDKEERISITQKEYRTAYELHKKGKIKILTFVRTEIWDHRENRSELARYLKSVEIAPSLKSEIQSHPSKICENSDFIISFINEVGRNNETRMALENRDSNLPTGNWIYTFHDFGDIVNAIQTQILSDTPIEKSALKHLLLLELRENLKAALLRSKDDVYSPEVFVINLYNEHPITTEALEKPIFSINARRWRMLSSIGIHALGMKFQTRILEHCSRTSTFVDFDPIIGKSTATPIHNDLVNLVREIESFHLVNNSDTLEIIFKFTPKNGYSGDDPIPVPTMKLWALIHLYDRWINVINITHSLIKHLANGASDRPRLRPRSPIPDMNPQLEAEAVTDDLLDKFLEGTT